MIENDEGHTLSPKNNETTVAFFRNTFYFRVIRLPEKLRYCLLKICR
jgi:hypothetical protein